MFFILFIVLLLFDFECILHLASVVPFDAEFMVPDYASKILSICLGLVGTSYFT